MKNLIILSILLLTVSCANTSLLVDAKTLSSVDDLYLSNAISINKTAHKDKDRYVNISLINTKTILRTDKSLLVPSNPDIKYILTLNGWKHKTKKKYEHYVTLNITYSDKTWRTYKKVSINGIKRTGYTKLKSRVYCGNIRYTGKCDYTEGFLVTIPDSYIRTMKDKGFDIKVSGKYDRESINVHARYLNAYLNKNL